MDLFIKKQKERNQMIKKIYSYLKKKWKKLIKSWNKSSIAFGVNKDDVEYEDLKSVKDLE